MGPCPPEEAGRAQLAEHPSRLLAASEGEAPGRPARISGEQSRPGGPRGSFPHAAARLTKEPALQRKQPFRRFLGNPAKRVCVSPSDNAAVLDALNWLPAPEIKLPTRPRLAAAALCPGGSGTFRSRHDGCICSGQGQQRPCGPCPQPKGTLAPTLEDGRGTECPHRDLSSRKGKEVPGDPRALTNVAQSVLDNGTTQR